MIKQVWLAQQIAVSLQGQKVVRRPDFARRARVSPEDLQRLTTGEDLHRVSVGALLRVLSLAGVQLRLDDPPRPA